MSDMPLKMLGSSTPFSAPGAARTASQGSRNTETTASAPVDGFQQSAQPEGPTAQVPPTENEAPGTVTEEPEDPNAHWVNEQGTHNGTTFQVSHPPGWKLYTLPTTALVVSPDDGNTLTSFIWQTGMGAMDPRKQLNNVLAFNGVQNYQVLDTTPIQTVTTPAGSYRMIEQDAVYDYKGEKCHHHVISLVNDSNDPMMAFWSGSIIWLQSPESKWNDSAQTLQMISGSMCVAPPAAAAPPPSDSGSSGGAAPVAEKSSGTAAPAARTFVPGGGYLAN